MNSQSSTQSAPARSGQDRRSFMVIGTVTTVLAGVHLADHVLRGERVLQEHLDPNWNHSGWPFTGTLSPFSFSLAIVMSVLVGGLWLTVRGKAWAGYWLGASILLGGIVTVVHLVPTPNQESPSVIYNSWPDQPVLGALAVAVTLLIVGALILMGVNAVRVYRRSGTWR